MSKDKDKIHPWFIHSFIHSLNKHCASHTFTFAKGTKEAPSKMNCRACYCWLSPFVQMARIATPKLSTFRLSDPLGQRASGILRTLRWGICLDYLGGPNLVSWRLTRSSSCRDNSRGMCGCGWHEEVTCLPSIRRKSHRPRNVGGPQKLERQEHHLLQPPERNTTPIPFWF